MIRLGLADDGSIVLNAFEESTFLTHGADGDLRLYLNARPGETATSFLLGPVDRVRDVVEYLETWARRFGFKLEYDATLSPLIAAVNEEETLILDITAKKPGKVDLSSSTVLPNRTLLPHQVSALEHALRVGHSANFSVPGSGKTSVALGAYVQWKLRSEVDHLLVIGPASCFDPWEDEFRACFGQSPHVIRLSASATERRRALSKLTGVDLILSTYQMAHREENTIRALLSRFRFMLVLDESHNIKRYQEGAWAETLLRLAPYAKHRMILTGTPAPRSAYDLWTQFTFLWPSSGLLGSRTDFERNYAGPDVDKLRDRIVPFYHRTPKDELGLPEPVVETTVLNPDSWPPLQRRIVRLLEIRTMRDLLDLPIRPADVVTLRHWRRARIIRLLQAASNPALLAGRDPNVDDSDFLGIESPELADLVSGYNGTERSAKIRWTVDKTEALVRAGRKVVVWTFFVGNIKLLERLLEKSGVVTAYGEIKPFEEVDDDAGEISRERNIRQFKADADTMVLVANPAATGESISLHQVCNDAIYLDRTFNCGQFLQPMDRIHRVGLPPDAIIRYHIPVMNCAVDRLVDRRLTARQKLLYSLMMDRALPVGGWSEDLVVDDDDELNEIMAELRSELTGGPT